MSARPSGTSILARWPRVLGVLLLAGCASAAERFESGLSLEAEGRSMEAALQYVDALRKDPTLASAREGLERAGRRAIEQATVEAESLAAAGSAEPAARQILTGEELLRQASSVGVALPLPDDFEGRRRSLLDQAADAALAVAEGAERNRRWSEAVDAYGRILNRYDPAPALAREAAQRQSGALLDWSEESLEEGRYRSAHEIAGRVLGSAGSGEAEMSRARDVQEEALIRGTVRVAVLPVASRNPRGIQADLEIDLSDILELEHWSRAPLFIDVLDVTRVRRAVREVAPGVPFLSDRDVANIVRNLGADVGVLVEIQEVRIGETEPRRRNREARSAGGVVVTWFEERGRLRYDATATIGVLEGPYGFLDNRTASATATARFERGVFDGNPANLELSRADRRLFDPEVMRAAHLEARTEVLSRLAQDIASATFARLERLVP